MGTMEHPKKFWLNRYTEGDLELFHRSWRSQAFPQAPPDMAWLFGEEILCPPVPLRVTENSNCVILNGAKRSEESWFYAGWESRFFALTGSE